MRESQQQTLQTDEEATLVVSGEEATLVAPRFDDEETLVARPVVPLGAEAAEAPLPPVETRAASPLPVYARRRYAPRRSWMLALVLVSVLIGGVLGGAGLYLYQRRSNDAAVAPPQPQTPAETQQQPAPTTEVSDAPQTEVPVTDAPAEAKPVETESVEAEAVEAAPPARAPETTPAAERDTPSAGGSAATRKRGKKGEQDEEVERPARREARPDTARPVARADDDARPREARRVDTIFYRQRRAARRERVRRDADTDRLRRIFEGAP